MYWIDKKQFFKISLWFNTYGLTSTINCKYEATIYFSISNIKPKSSMLSSNYLVGFIVIYILKFGDTISQLKEKRAHKIVVRRVYTANLFGCV